MKLLQTWVRTLALWGVVGVMGLGSGVNLAWAFSPNSPIDMAHILGADFNRRTGEPTGGHSLLKGA